MNPVETTQHYLLERLPSVPKTVVVLGSGVVFEEGFEPKLIFPFESLPYAHTTAIEGHQGQLVYGLLKGTPLLVQQGRRHFYEGFTMREVVHMIEVYHACGVENLLLTNACGGINTDKVGVGSLLVLNDFINFMPSNPLIGAKHPHTERFPDMTEPFDLGLRTLLKDAFEGVGEPYVEGVYASFMGPYYETKAEIQMLKTLGADVVGMSTVPEVIQAHALGLKVAAVSLITNLATGIQTHPHAHKNVVAQARHRSQTLTQILAYVIDNLN